MVLISLIAFYPTLVLAEDVGSSPEVLGTSTAIFTAPEAISQGRALLGQYLNVYLGASAAYKFLNDPRLTLDTSVIRSGITGKGFDYFSADFGLTSSAATKDGLSYRAKNWAHFKKARAKYGVDSYYILGILRLETYFGNSSGKRSLPSTLYSIFVLDPARRNFAWRELAVFLDLAKTNGTDPFLVKSSSAGAYGIAQFIPSSVYNFAVDGSGDGKIDLFNDADAIMSVANYLNRNGWENGIDKKRAIYAYNHDNGYVSAVLAYAENIKQIIEK